MSNKFKDTEIGRISKKSEAIIPQEVIEKKILLIKGHKVMLDKDLAQL